MGEAKLKPCPFCGGDATITIMHNEELTWIRYKAVCRRCLAETAKFERSEIAEIAWNKRAYEK